ncbi:calcium-binding protein [Streptomyces sp. 6N223]|uniref:calcium-binding protein n=1 Tax=Streptomyces sp. 6N223 TaxID=3457412 RepID=UPI003FD4FCF8
MRKMRTHLSNVTTLGVAAVAGTGIALWPASPASAQEGATASVDPPGGSQLSAIVDYQAGDDQANDVTITDGAGPLDYVIDDVVPIEAGEGCTHPDGADLTRVVCSLAPEDEGQGWFYVSLGDMNDTIDAGSTAGGEVWGGPGDDVMATSLPTSWWLDGEEGDDTITGSHDMRGGEGDDTITGAEGIETSVYGDAGRDTITTFGGEDFIWGDRGLTTGEGAADEIRTGGGDDIIFGEYGDDALYGEAGDDTIDGGPGDDIIDGGPGNDEETQD